MPPDFGKAPRDGPSLLGPWSWGPRGQPGLLAVQEPHPGEGVSWRGSHPPVPAAAAAPRPLPSLGGPSPEVLSAQGLRSVPATRQCLPWGALVGGNGARGPSGLLGKVS